MLEDLRVGLSLAVGAEGGGVWVGLRTLLVGAQGGEVALNVA